MIKVFKEGFNYSEDGPGNRLVIHLLGCNLLCPWCSNSDGMSERYVESYMKYDTITLFNKIMSCKRLFFDGGGVTFTGGEVSLQLDELKELFIKLKENSINIAIESNASSLKILDYLELIDYVIFDFKHYDDKIHKKILGLSNEIVKEVILKSTKLKDKIHIRIPLVNGFNANSEIDIKGFNDFFNTLDKSKFDLELLKYHEYGKEKWLKNNRNYSIANGFITDDIYKKFVAGFKNNGIEIITT